MGETIRTMMVAMLALSWLAVPPGERAAAQTGSSFAFPESLQTSGGAPAGPAGSVGIPNFTNGVDPQRATSLPGGPSTAPNQKRDDSWYKNLPRRGLPTTDPSASRGTVATVAATEVPNSLEAKLLAAQREAQAILRGGGSNQANATSANQSQINAAQVNAAQANAAQANAAQANAAANPNRPFIKTPDGINLPERELQGRSSGGSIAIPGFSQPATPGANTAQGNLANVGGIAGSNVAAATGAGQNTAGTFGEQFGTKLGIPGQTTATAQAAAAGNLLTQWSRADIEKLGAMFGLSRQDRRLTDPSFVNQLFQEYKKDQARRKAESDAQRRRQLNDPRYASLNDPSGVNWPAGQQPGTGVGTQAGSTPGWVNKMPDSPFSSRGTEQVLYDKDGNPVVLAGNRAAPAEPKQDSKSGSLTLEQITKLLDERERSRSTPPMYANYPPGMVPYSVPGAAPANPGMSRGGVNPGYSGVPNGAPQGGTSQRPPQPRDRSEDLVGSASDSSKNPSLDRAGFGSSALVGKSNPFVNVFLMLSIFFNLFLFWCIQRLWNNYRNMSVANRLAASGIGSE